VDVFENWETGLPDKQPEYVSYTVKLYRLKSDAQDIVLTTSTISLEANFVQPPKVVISSS